MGFKLFIKIVLYIAFIILLNTIGFEYTVLWCLANIIAEIGDVE